MSTDRLSQDTERDVVAEAGQPGCGQQIQQISGLWLRHWSQTVTARRSPRSVVAARVAVR